MPTVLDQYRIVLEARPATSTVTSLTSSASSQTALAAKTGRRAATFYNDADKSCYLKLGGTASTTSFTVRIYPNGFFAMPFPIYTGVIDAIWDAGPTGSLRITEMED